MAAILDGKAVSAKIKADIKEEIGLNNLKVGLAVVIVGEDPASLVYVKNKKKDCEECGITSYEYALPETIQQKQLLDLIRTLNDDQNINGILVQSPLPETIDFTEVVETISPLKDVDAFHSVNVSGIMRGKYVFSPCTPAGVMELIHSAGAEVSGKECVVVGRSDIVGKPMAMLLLHEHGTVTLCHSKTANLGSVTSRADILVAAVGKAGLIKADMVKKGAVVIDVGMNRGEDGKLCGDVDFAEVEKKAGFITPVPGGVGPMTRAILMRNTLAAKKMTL